MKILLILVYALALPVLSIVMAMMGVLGVAWVEQRVKRFSIRDLLILTAIVAVVLGLIVSASRSK